MSELNEQELDTVTGGSAAPPDPMASGFVVYECPVCHAQISADTRSTSVTCPNRNCRQTFQIKKGRLC